MLGLFNVNISRQASTVAEWLGGGAKAFLTDRHSIRHEKLISCCMRALMYADTTRPEAAPPLSV